MTTLGIETSCDETAVAVVKDGKKILSNVVASSTKFHQKYGGIVPEVAARKQIEYMTPVLDEAMSGFKPKDIDAIAVTIGPGLVGSLLVGIETAKTLAMAWNKPIIPVNHVLAHIYSAFIEDESEVKILNFPAIALVVSGGHTELYLMKSKTSLKWLGGTVDDAAGECFDKTARLLGLSYPGGPEIEAKASSVTYPASRIKFPRPMIKDNSFNFSFSGLKTAVMREWKKYNPSTKFKTSNRIIEQFSYEIQEAITDVLVKKTIKAAQIHQTKSIIVTGGVAANKKLREKFKLEIRNLKLEITSHIPHPKLCVDSAAYIAAYAYYHKKPVSWEKIQAEPGLSVEMQ